MPLQRGAPAPLPHCGTLDWTTIGVSADQRGAPAPLPHCGGNIPGWLADAWDQRGAPAPLPHCGEAAASDIHIVSGTTRGAGAPPSLRQRTICRGGALI